MSTLLWTNEKRGIWGTQDDILVLDCTAPAATQDLHFYRKALKIFRLPEFQLDGSAKSPDETVPSTCTAAVHRFRYRSRAL
jgi:hypothetical protein